MLNKCLFEWNKCHRASFAIVRPAISSNAEATDGFVCSLFFVRSFSPGNRISSSARLISGSLRGNAGDVRAETRTLSGRGSDKRSSSLHKIKRNNKRQKGKKKKKIKRMSLKKCRWEKFRGRILFRDRGKMTFKGAREEPFVSGRLSSTRLRFYLLSCSGNLLTLFSPVSLRSPFVPEPVTNILAVILTHVQ